MQVCVWEMDDGSVLFCVDPEGSSPESLLDALHRAAVNMYDAEVSSSLQADGKTIVFGEGPKHSFSLELEAVDGNVVVTPLYFENDGRDMPAEDLLVVLLVADMILSEEAELDEVMRGLLAGFPPTKPQIDQLTGLVDDDGITIELGLTDEGIVPDAVHTLEGFGGKLTLTPIPRPYTPSR